jgi:hypothetical protein
MKLPGGERAFVDVVKLREYCLSPVHPRGRHKARVFASVLGLTQADAESLRDQLLRAARERPAVAGDSDASAPDKLLRIIGLRRPMAEIGLLSTVALLADMPEKGLRRGQVGTVVESLGAGVYEIEFSDDSGRSYASLALRADQVMQLHHEPGHRAA